MCVIYCHFVCYRVYAHTAVLLMYIISINQSINFYSANIPDEARLSGATAKSVFNSKIEETALSTHTHNTNKGVFITFYILKLPKSR